MMKRTINFLTLMALLFILLSGSVRAMSSNGYRLDWFVPLTGGGGAASSTHYAVNVTVGQSVIGSPSGSAYQSCLGYWCGATAAKHTIYLPLALKN